MGRNDFKLTYQTHLHTSAALDFDFNQTALIGVFVYNSLMQHVISSSGCTCSRPIGTLQAVMDVLEFGVLGI